jgi:hypothetical protein
MKLITTLLCAVLTGALALPALAATQEIHGVQVPDSASVAGSNLALNGAGTRVKMVFKVYVAALYLGTKASKPQEVTTQPGPKRLSVTMVRDLDAADMSKALMSGIENNLGKEALSSLAPQLARMSQIFADQKKLVVGDNFLIDWVPGKGTVVTVKGVVQGEPFKEPEFFNALMAVWLGSSPADDKLKEALLGTGK